MEYIFRKDLFDLAISRMEKEQMDKNSTTGPIQTKEEELRKVNTQVGRAYGMPTNEPEQDCYKTTEAPLKTNSIRSQLLTERAYLHHRLAVVNETIALLPEDIDRLFVVRENLMKLGFRVP